MTTLATPIKQFHDYLVKQLQPDPFPDQHAEREGLIHILVAERHFLRECDEAIITFAGGLGTGPRRPKINSAPLCGCA